MGDTASMWGEMLGLGPVLKTVADPAFHEQIKQFLGAMYATHQLAAEAITRCERMERKLDAIAAQLGMTFDGAIDADVAGAGNRPAIPAQHGTTGNGGLTATAGAGDDGAGGAAATRRIA